jgi:uncharacterized protein
MDSFGFSTRLWCAGFALLTLSVPADSQDRNGLIQRCLSISDVNERVDCLESGAAPDAGAAASTSNTNPGRQSPTNPSFDCRMARSSIERAICGDITLSEWDSRMGRLFQQALRLTKDRQSLLESQRLWLTQRDTNCGSVVDTAVWSCILDATKLRTATLAKATTTIVEAGPTIQPPQPSPAPPMPTTSQARSQSPLNEPLGNPSLTTSSTSQNPSTSTPSKENNDFGPLTLIVFILGIGIALKILNTMRRRRHLITKYGEEIAVRIIARKVWQGMTEEQLTDSWGSPVDVGREIIRTKIKETWKYGRTGKNRYSNRVYLENGIVIGWKN